MGTGSQSVEFLVLFSFQCLNIGDPTFAPATIAPVIISSTIESYRVRVMIGVLVQARVRLKIRIRIRVRVGVMFKGE